MNLYEIAYKSCFRGDVEKLKECNIDPDNAFFQYAVVSGQLEIIKYLIEELNMRPEKDIFLEAIKRDYVNLVRYMNTYIPYDYDCLKIALENGCWTLIDDILSSGLSLTHYCVSFIIYGKHIKRYITYRQVIENGKLKAATKIQNWWLYDCGKRKTVFSEAQEPF